MLTAADLHALEASLLPALERHHLRLLAHSLRCLQQADGMGGLQAWADQQANLQSDPSFIPVLLEQLAKAERQLAQIGRDLGKAPLQLELSDLVTWGQGQADARLGLTPPAP